MMDEHEQRVDKIGEIVTACHALKELFAKLVSAWQDTDKKIGVRVEKASGEGPSLRLFDGTMASIMFAMVINGRGEPWGKIAFVAGDKVIYAVYFDPQGYLHDQPQRNRDDRQVPPLLTHPYQQNALVAKFMEAYLETFREKGEGAR